MQHEELKDEPAEASEELQDASELCDVYGPWRIKEEILLLLTEEGSGKEAMEEAQDTNNPLPTAPSPDPVHILPAPVAHSTPETPTTKAIPSAPLVQYFRNLVTYVQTLATTSQTLAAAHIA